MSCVDYCAVHLSRHTHLSISKCLMRLSVVCVAIGVVASGLSGCGQPWFRLGVCVVQLMLMLVLVRSSFAVSRTCRISGPGSSLQGACEALAAWSDHVPWNVTCIGLSLVSWSQGVLMLSLGWSFLEFRLNSRACLSAYKNA